MPLNTTKIVYCTCFFFGLLFFCYCTETGENSHQGQEDKEDSIKDSLKVFFHNFSTGKLDSLNEEISQNIISSKGLNISRFLKAVSQKDSATYEYYAQYSYWLSLRHRYIEAIECLNLASKVAKDKSRYYFDKACAWAYIQPLHNRDSVYFYLNLATKNDTDGYYYFARSQFNCEDGYNENAMKDINQAINLSPKDTSYLNQRGLYKALLNNYKGAIKDMKNVSLNNINNYKFYQIKAVAYDQLNMFKEALEAAEKCISLNPNVGVAYLVRGNARYKLGQKDAGIEDLRKAAKLGDSASIKFIKEYDEYKRTHKEI
jgi:tetratricopeptide (TPR) repeat protein